MTSFKRFFSFIALSLSLPAFAFNLPLPENLSHFAFGSCAKERKEQPIWSSILEQDPELFLFIGDNHYADYWMPEGKTLQTSPVTKVERLKEAYSDLAKKPGYQQIKKRVPVLATWDDHDYGSDDGGKEYPLKIQSQDLFMDFYEFGESDPIREQKGIYYSRMIGEAGRRVQLIFLDTRYHRDALTLNPEGRPEGKGPYVPNQDASTRMLGEIQWKWLENELKQSADLRFIISSIQVVAYEHSWESWGNMPHERQRLYNLIAQTQANGVIFLSGDRHLTEVSVDKGQLGAKVPYPMWDLTASGMTDDYKPVEEANSFRRGNVHRGSHFAAVDIDWRRPVAESVIDFTAIGIDNKMLNRQSIRLGDLRPE